MTRHAWFAAALALALAMYGCGASSGQLEIHVPEPTWTVGGGTWAVSVFTDLDTIRDVDAGGGFIYVATDLGLLVYADDPESASTPAVRLTRVEGLPSNDVTSVAVQSDGTVLVATGSGLAVARGTSLLPAAPPAPAIGDIVDMHVDGDGTVWACGMWGVARLTRESGWQGFGEAANCTRLVPGPGGALWIGTTAGLWKVEGDVVREHSQGQGIPESYVLDIAPIADGKAYALVQGPAQMLIGYFDGRRWFGYTLRDFGERIVGMTTRGSDVLLFTRGNVLALATAEEAAGTRLVPISRSAADGVRSYRARIGSISTFSGPERPPMEEVNVFRGAEALASIPENQPTIAAPALTVRPLREGPNMPSRVRTVETRVFVADQGRGVVEIGSPDRVFQSRELITPDLQIAGVRATTWLMSTSGSVARFDRDRLVRVGMPEDITPDAIADGPGGVYLVARVNGQPDTIRVYRHDGQSWARLIERTLDLGGTLRGLPFVGVDAQRRIWVALKVAYENRTTTRGVAVLDLESDSVVYHHRASGEGVLQLQDEVTGIDLGQEGMAWFSSFHGALRLGNSQAVVFNESRGVRGEIVTDVAVESGDRVWVAAAEGVGLYENQRFEFNFPSVVRETRVQSLAFDQRGQLWGVGANGVVVYDGQNWSRLELSPGVPAGPYTDVEVDSQNRVWIVSESGLVVLAPPEASDPVSPS